MASKYGYYFNGLATSTPNIHIWNVDPIAIFIKNDGASSVFINLGGQTADGTDREVKAGESFSWSFVIGPNQASVVCPSGTSMYRLDVVR